MNIALISHDAKKRTYGAILYRLLRHPKPAQPLRDGTTGKMVSEATGLTIQNSSPALRAATSRSRRASPAMRWTCSCFSGILGSQTP